MPHRASSGVVERGSDYSVVEEARKRLHVRRRLNRSALTPNAANGAPSRVRKPE